MFSKILSLNQKLCYLGIFKPKINVSVGCITFPYLLEAKLDQSGAYENKRYLSVLSLNPSPGSTCLTTKNDIKQFLSMYPDVINELKTTCWYDDTSTFANYYERMLNQLTPNKTHGIGQSVAASYKTLVPEKNHTPEDIHLANILGWCIELLCTAITMGDDIRDGAEARHHAICWHKNEDIGLRAIIDAQMLENAIYLVIKKYFSNHLFYVPIIELFQQVSMETLMGQSLDEIYTIKSKKSLLELFTADRYNTLVKYKTAYVNILPTRLAMYLANIYNLSIHKEASTILLQIGHFWQVENDIIDCFGDPSVFGKDSTDIPNRKCTWLIVEALKNASLAQKTILEQNFGRSEPDCEKAVRSVYQELNLFNSYVSYKKQGFELIRKDAEEIGYKPLRRLVYKLCEIPTGYEVLSTT